MRQRIALFLTLCVVAAGGLAQSLQHYEYWVDTGYDGRTVEAVGADDITLNVDVSQLRPGLHYFNVRVQNDQSVWSALKRDVFYLPREAEPTAAPQRYEYWIDGDYAARTTSSVTTAEVALTLDVSQLSTGLHFFNVRAQDSRGKWGALERDVFYLPREAEPTAVPQRYEYWIDGDYAARTTTDVTTAEVALTLDVSHLSAGLHYFNVRAQDSHGKWGSLQRDYFYVPRTEQSISNEALIAGYEYSFGQLRQYVAVTPCTEYEMRQTVLAIPELSGFGSLEEGCTWSFSNNTVTLKRRNSLTFAIRFRSEKSVWSSPEGDQFELSDTIVKQAYSLTAGQQCTFSKAQGGSYEAIRISANETRDYYLQTTQACRVQLYKAGGTLLKTIGSEALLAGERCELEAGTTYYAIVYNMVTDADNPGSQMSVKLLLEANMVLTPTISYANETVTITSEQEESVIYYTLDGTKPTTGSNRYAGPFTLDHNATIRAIATVEGKTQSEVTEYVVDTYKVENVTFGVEGLVLSLHTNTPNATIYYGIGENATPATVYSTPIVLTDNQPIKAIARRQDFHDSEVTVYTHSLITCPDVAFSYDGHHVTLTGIEGTTIYYTTDGSQPTTQSAVYNTPLDVFSLCTLNVFATRPWMNDARATSHEITYVYDGKTAIVKDKGLLAKAFEWCGQNNVRELAVSGPVDATDLSVVRQLPNLQTLDMEQAALEGQALPDEALKGAAMRWFVSPASLNSVGRGAFEGCTRLAAITWNTITARLTTDAFGSQVNPNLLYYVKSENMVTIGNANIVSNGRARTVTLHDGTEYRDFYCPVEFLADNISYTRNFRQKTLLGVCQGWETLALPFTVQAISHWKNGAIAPFSTEGVSNATEKPFWLARLDANGFVNASAIEANTPYLLSMPNDSAAYGERNLLAGEVTFSAKNVTVGVTDVEAHRGLMGEVAFIPNYELRQPSADVYAINLWEAHDATHPEGSIFLPDYRQTRPFEAYTTSYAAHAPRYMAIDDMGSGTTGIMDVVAKHRLYNTDVVKVYNLNGLLVKSGNRSEVMDHLPKGVYIIDGRKVVVK